MAGPSLRTYAITGNEAQHGGKQINKIITDNSNTYVDHLYFIFPRGRDEEEKLRHQLSDPEVSHFVIMRALQNFQNIRKLQFPYSEANVVRRAHETPGEGSQQDREPENCADNRIPPKLTCYDGDYEACKKGYLDGDSKTPLEKLLEDYEAGRAGRALMDALTTLGRDTNPAVLTIDGSRDHGSWTTHLALEMTDVLRKENILYHFCGQHSGKRGPWPHRVVEHFLNQLLNSHQQNFDSRAKQTTEAEIIACLGHDGNIKANVSSKELWGVFGKCLVRAKLKSVVMVLDKLDALHKECWNCKNCKGYGGMHRFEEFIAGLLSLIGGEVVVKIMVTSTSSDFIQDFRTRCGPP